MAEPIKIPQVGQTSIQGATGPRSKAGKERASRNAIKHGIYSDVVVLPTESRDKYQSLVSELWETLQPVGKLEEVLVEKIATLTWRHRRLLVAEGAEIRNSSEFWEWDKEQRERQEIAAGRNRLDVEQVFRTDPGLIWKIQDAEILTACLDLLSELRKEIESGGFDNKRDTGVLGDIYGPVVEFQQTLLVSYLTWFDTAEASDEERQREGYATPQQCKENVVGAIDDEIDRLRAYQRKQAAIVSERTKLEILRRNIPESGSLDRLLRYEASLERAFDRTLNQLERIQRLRRGQPVAPRIEIDLSR